MRVLIVDDDMAIVDVIRDSVNWKKFEIEDVETACNVEQAKIILKEKKTDIIISDIEMPMESGLELLKWFRGENLPGKFLLLTCHESFYYATEAIKYHAEEYLMKPFNLEMMEMVLQKIVLELKKEQQTKGWSVQDEREILLSFWNALFSGRIMNTQKDIGRELQRRNITIDWKEQKRLVISRVTNMEGDMEAYGNSLVLFILENLHSEILNENPENDSVIYFEHRDYCTFITICENEEEEVLRKKCIELIQKCGNLLDSTITCCISDACTVMDFYEKYQNNKKIFEKNILYYGKAFLECDSISQKGEYQEALHQEKMAEFLETGNKLGFMDFLKKELNAKVKLNILDGKMLVQIRQEIQQSVYVHLAKKGILASLLLSDETSIQMTARASQSVIDMIRWGNYLLSRVFEYEEEVEKSQTIVERINYYIQEHYKENIGRNEISSQFYLAPEYLSKMYKKKTGKKLKDAINEYRLEQAKALLKNKEMRVSDVAIEVGFDNFSYFSTLFKKSTGMTANEYRKQF